MSVLSFKDRMEIGGQLITWLLVIGGWFFISRDHNKREQRKELRAAVSALESRVRACEEKALEYWMLDAASERASSLGISIKSSIQGIATDLSRIQAQCPCMEASDELIAFRRALTGSPFETAQRIALSLGHERLTDISDASCELVDAIEKGFLLHAAELT